ncbi:MAG: HAD family hydrolase [Spirochaetes bacterium]|nr:HAD family hydrolase [Spirochaetota bacterium]
MSIRGIFFDLYGTLLVYGDMQAAWIDWLETFYDCMQKQGLSISIDAFSRRCDRFFGKEEPVSFQDGLTVFERRIKTLGIELGVELKPAHIGVMADTVVCAWQKHVSIDEEAAPVLRSLKPRKVLCLISNFDHPPHVYRILSEYGLGNLFKNVIVSAEVGYRKPDPAIFSKALKGTGLNGREVAYVGDTEEDVTGALAASMKPVVIMRERNGTDHRALDYSIDTGPGPNPAGDGFRDRARIITSLRELTSMF